MLGADAPYMRFHRMSAQSREARSVSAKGAALAVSNTNCLSTTKFLTHLITLKLEKEARPTAGPSHLTPADLTQRSGLMSPVLKTLRT